MRLLFDTHILIWAMREPARLSERARTLVSASDHVRSHSVVAIWEVAIKFRLGHRDFDLDPALFRSVLLDGAFQELDIKAEHALALATLPPIHRDPFDRMLVAQALHERLTLVTADAALARYPGDIMVI